MPRSVNRRGPDERRLRKSWRHIVAKRYDVDGPGFKNLACIKRLHVIRTPLQVLNDTRIASPCSQSWRAMRGDDRVRHCDHCDRKVFNLSRLSAADALSLLETNGYNVCVRLYKRRDGTVMTQDCSGASGSRWRIAAWAASLFASIFTAGCMGAVAAPRDPQQKCSQPTTQPTTASPVVPSRQ